MPRYDFQCRQCSHSFEIELPFGSDKFPKCPECGGETRKLIAPPAIHFRGKGFFNTDHKRGYKEHKESKAAKETRETEGTEDVKSRGDHVPLRESREKEPKKSKDKPVEA